MGVLDSICQYLSWPASSDEEAAPKTTVYVHRVSRPVNPASLQKALSDALGTPWPGGRPEKPIAAPTGEKKTAEPSQEGNEGEKKNGS